MVVFNGVKTENLWARYLNPKEDIFPAEIHELAYGLLNTYKNLIKKRNCELSLHEFVSKMIEYGTYVEKYVEKYKIKESPEIFKWWNEFFAIVSSRESHGAPVIKLILVAIYFTKCCWMRRGFYKIILFRKISKARGCEIDFKV